MERPLKATSKLRFAETGISLSLSLRRFKKASNVLAESRLEWLGA